MRLNKELWDPFCTWLVIENNFSTKHQAVSANKSRFNKIVLWFHNKDFNRGNFNVFIQEMMNNKYSKSYMNNMIKMAKNLGDYFVYVGLVPVNEFKNKKYFSEVKRGSKDTLTTEEIVLIADYIMPYKKNADFINKRQSALIWLLGTSGCRIGEAIDLTWDDVRLEPYPYVVFKDTKSNVDREVVIAKSVYDKIAALPKLNDQVFTSYRGGHFTEQVANTDIKERAKRVGITKNVYCHLFRKSYITTMVDEDSVDWFSLSTVVGHKNPATTLGYYEQSLKRKAIVARKHPLLNVDRTWKEKSQQLKDAVSKIFGSDDRVAIEEIDGKISVVISD